MEMEIQQKVPPAPDYGQELTDASHIMVRDTNKLKSKGNFTKGKIKQPTNQ